MRYITSLILGFILASPTLSKASEVQQAKGDTRSNTITSSTSQVPRHRQTTLFYELGGMSLTLVNVNIDRRFKSGMDGLGWRAGIGYSFPSVTMPIGVNYLLGKRKHFFELGLGATFVLDFHASGSKSKERGFCLDVAGTSCLGYRYQPLSGKGFTWGAGFAPLLTREVKGWSFIPYIPCLRIGYTF